MTISETLSEARSRGIVIELNDREMGRAYSRWSEGRA